MVELYNFLAEKAHQSSWLSNNRLLFEMSGYELIFDLKPNRNVDTDSIEKYSNLDFQIIETVKKLEISACYIASSEYLGYRADTIVYNEPISICLRMYEVLQYLKKYKQCVVSYELSQNEGYSEGSGGAEFCNLEPNYIFKIQLSEFYYLDKPFFLNLVESLVYSEVKPPFFYWFFYKQYKRISDSKHISIVTTNTKSRRLGYLKILSNYISKEKKVPASRINQKFENHAFEFQHELSNYKNDKGLIKKTKTGTSSKPYVELAYDLGIISKLNNTFTVSKTFKVYNQLQCELKSLETDNSFTLSFLDKIFFLETILREDFLYISIVLEMIYIRKKTSYKELSDIFHPHLIRRLDHYLSNSFANSRTKDRVEANKIRDRIRNWKEVDVYLEHVLMPRLNWLIDLDLLKMNGTNDIKLTNEGQRLFENICFWNDINWSHIISPDEFLNYFTIHLMESVYYGFDRTVEMNESAKEIIDQRILIVLDESFKHFKTLAPNRVTSSQAITYTKYRLYLNEDIKVGHNYIVNLLESTNQDRFIYKYQSQYGDGYIQRKIK